MGNTLQMSIILLLFTGLLGSCSDHREPTPTKGCRIIKQVERYQDNILESETTYSYDSEGRVIRSASFLPALSFSLIPRDQEASVNVSYSYRPMQLVVDSTITLDGKTRQSTTTLKLNAQGFVDDSIYVRDADNYLIREIGPTLRNIRTYVHDYKAYTRYTIQNGNVTLSDHYLNIRGTNFIESTRFRYDTLKPNLPNVFIFKGKTSRNLIIFTDRKEVALNGPFAGITNGNTITDTYSYTYDEQGRVKRRVIDNFTGTPGNPKFSNRYRYITEFTYACD